MFTSYHCKDEYLGLQSHKETLKAPTQTQGCFICYISIVLIVVQTMTFFIIYFLIAIDASEM